MTGVWSSFETVILRHIVSLGEDYKNIGCALKLYNDIVYYSTAPSTFFPFLIILYLEAKHMLKYWPSSNWRTVTRYSISNF